MLYFPARAVQWSNCGGGHGSSCRNDSSYGQAQPGKDELLLVRLSAKDWQSRGTASPDHWAARPAAPQPRPVSQDQSQKLSPELEPERARRSESIPM